MAATGPTWIDKRYSGSGHAGLLTDNGKLKLEHIAKMRTRPCLYVTSGRRFHKDGSFIQHRTLPVWEVMTSPAAVRKAEHPVQCVYGSEYELITATTTKREQLIFDMVFGWN